MPADFHIDVQNGIVFSKGLGVLDQATAIDHMTRLKAHPDFRPDLNQLMDLTGFTRVELSATEMAGLARKSLFAPESRRAIVVTSELHYGLARMFEMMRESHGEEGIEVFQSMKDALVWLGLDKEPEPDLFPRLQSDG